MTIINSMKTIKSNCSLPCSLSMNIIYNSCNRVKMEYVTKVLL